MLTYKKIAILLCALTVFMPLTALAGSFSDVPENHSNFKAIEFLKQFKVVNGYPDGTFRPDNGVNRAEAAKMILLAGGIDMLEADKESVLFPDFNNDAWFYDIVYTAVENKVISGYPDGTFKPDRPVILAEALKMSVKSFGAVNLPSDFESPYPDVDSAAWFASFAEFAKERNLVLPQDDGFLHPEHELSRAELAELLYRFRYSANRKWQAVPFDFQWATYENRDLSFQTLTPPNWEIVNNPRSVIFWKKDPAFTNVHYQWLYPNSASITFSTYPNEENFTKEEFFEQLKISSTFAYDEVENNELRINGVDVLEIKKVGGHAATYIFEMPSDQFLVIFTDYGGGDFAPYLKQAIDAVIMHTAHFDSGPVDASVVKGKIFEKLLIEGGAFGLLDMLEDEILIEADPLGIGTGPVDYYYSLFVDMTLKIERNGGILLDTREGQTSAF